jgi:hypothetical protein
MLINGRIYRMISGNLDEYSVFVQSYRHLKGEPFSDSRIKHLIVVEKISRTGPHPIRDTFTTTIAALRGIVNYSGRDPELSNVPVFESVESPNYLATRAVFYGETGLKLANDTLSKLSKTELGAGVFYYLVWKYTTDIVIDLQAYSPISNSWETIQEIEASLNSGCFENHKPPLFYVWSGTTFKICMLLENDSGNSHIIYREVHWERKLENSEIG